MPMNIVLIILAVCLVTLVAALAFVAWKLGLLEPKPTGDEPYRCCDRVLSEAERELHTALVAALPILCTRANRSDLPLLLAKVRLGDVLTVDRGKAAENARTSGKSGSGASQSARNKINQKHVDFLLCRPTDTRPPCATMRSVVEPEDTKPGATLRFATHDRPDRQERDRFLDAACKAAPPPPSRCCTSSAPHGMRSTTCRTSPRRWRRSSESDAFCPERGGSRGTPRHLHFGFQGFCLWG